MSTLAYRARHGSVAERTEIARGAETPPELLTWLAADPSPNVRMAVAANRATPPQAGLLLAEDADAAVRASLARRIGALAPGLEDGARDRLARMTGAILSRLAEDAVVEVRQVIADAVAALPNAPRELILRLAADTALPVAEPVLRLSPLLTEADLIALVATPPADFTRRAIAARPHLPEAVSEAVAASADSPAIATLLNNHSAAIREATLDRLVAGSVREESWQAALVRRPRLPPKALRQLGVMVAGQMLDALAARQDLPPGLAEDVRARVAAKLDMSAQWAAEAADREAMAADLAAAAGISATRMEAALALRSPRALVALSWKAGWSPKLAAHTQKVLGIAEGRVVHPAPDGGWSLSEDELRWQMELLEDLPG